MLYVSMDMYDHRLARISFYDFEGHELSFHRTDYKPIGHDITLPSNFSTMKSLAGKIANDMNNPFSRIDLYPIDGETYFSEITLYPANGMIAFEPKEADLMLGKMMTI